MAYVQLKNANLGKARAGLSTVGYSFYNTNGTISGSRNTSGVYEIVSGSGLYAANMVFSDSWNGSIVWDSGQIPPIFATEQFNYQEANPAVDLINVNVLQLTGSVNTLTSSIGNIGTSISQMSGTVNVISSSVSTIEQDVVNVSTVIGVMYTDLAFVKAMTGGRWKIVSNQMIFYDADNTTIVARFDLKDQTGFPTMSDPFERVRL